MDIPGISANDPSFLPANPFGAQGLDRDAFMRLLVTQLQNQDPLEPLQNEEFVAQLANFSSLEQLQTLNQNVVGMIALNQSNALLSQLTQSSALIGQEVSWQDPTTSASSSGVVERVKIVDGLALLEIEGTDVPLAAVTEVLGAPAPAESETGA
jgi:flagellar basal-body rod modification protein FlgD